MQQTLNFYAKQIMSHEELTQWDESLRELIGNIFRYNYVEGAKGGILDALNLEGNMFINNFFSVSLGSIQVGGYNTLKIGPGRAVLNMEDVNTQYIAGLDINNESLRKQMIVLFKYLGQDKIEIPNIASYGSGDKLYVGFKPIWNPLEEGLCTISGTSNQVVIAGGDFTKLRGQATKNPTKIRFYEESGAVPTNYEIYEVISVIDDNNIIISGVVSHEDNLKMMIVGSYDLAAQGSIDDKFCYVTATGQLYFTTDTDSLKVGGFTICRLDFTGAGVFSIVPLQSDNLFNFAYSDDLMYKSRVQTVTGAKTFEGDSPIFGVKTTEKLDWNSFVAGPLNIHSNNDPDSAMQSRLVIPTGYGTRCVKVKTTTVNNAYLKSITFQEKGTSEGDHFYMYIDPEGGALTVILGTGEDEVCINNFNSTGNYAIIPGAVLDFWADENKCWHIMNSDIAYYVSDIWVEVDKMRNGTGVLLDSTTNIAKYKRTGNQVSIYIEAINSSDNVAKFTLPYSFPFVVNERMGNSAYLDSSYITVNPSGDIYINVGVGTPVLPHKQIIIQL